MNEPMTFEQTTNLFTRYVIGNPDRDICTIINYMDINEHHMTLVLLGESIRNSSSEEQKLLLETIDRN